MALTITRNPTIQPQPLTDVATPAKTAGIPLADRIAAAVANGRATGGSSFLIGTAFTIYLGPFCLLAGAGAGALGAVAGAFEGFRTGNPY